MVAPAPGTAVQQGHPVYGNVLVAARHFSPGDAVLIEREPLMFTEEESDLAEQVYEAHQALHIACLVDSRDAALDLSLQLLAYCKADEAARAVLMRMFRPCIATCPARGYIDAIELYVQQLHHLATSLEPALDSTDSLKIAQTDGADTVQHQSMDANPQAADGSAGSMPPSSTQPLIPSTAAVLAPCISLCAISEGCSEATQALLVWACNSYAWTEGGCAILTKGSLVNHSCTENTRYRIQVDSQQGSQGVFMAVQPIEPGDIITTNYLGYDEHSMASTPLRQRVLLQTKMFSCTCQRCTQQADWYRAICCPYCSCKGQAATTSTSPQPGVSDTSTCQIAMSHSKGQHSCTQLDDAMAVHNGTHAPASVLVAGCCQGYIIHYPAAHQTTAGQEMGGLWRCDLCGACCSHEQVADWIDTCAAAIPQQTEHQQQQAVRKQEHHAFAGQETAEMQQHGALLPSSNQQESKGEAMTLVLSDRTSAGSSSNNVQSELPMGLYVSQLEAQLEEAVFNLQRMRTDCVVVGTIQVLQPMLRHMRQVFGGRHWTTNALRVALIEDMSEALLLRCHQHLDQWLSCHDDDTDDMSRTVEDGTTPAAAAATTSTQATASMDAAIQTTGTRVSHLSDTGLGDNSNDGLNSMEHGPHSAVRMVVTICLALHQVWHCIAKHTMDTAEVLLKSVACPAATALLSAVQSDLLKTECGSYSKCEQCSMAQHVFNAHARMGETTMLNFFCVSQCNGGSNGCDFVMQLTEDHMCHHPVCVREFAVRTALLAAEQLIVFYEQYPWFDVDGEFGLPEALRVQHECRSIMDAARTSTCCGHAC